MKSSVIQYICNCISTCAYVFPAQFYNNVSIKIPCYAMKLCRKSNNVYVTVINNYNKIKMCDLELFLRSGHIYRNACKYVLSKQLNVWNN